MNVITFQRCGKEIVTFRQDSVPVNFFDVARQLGIKVRVTGNLELTHEAECFERDFDTLINLASGEANGAGNL